MFHNQVLKSHLCPHYSNCKTLFCPFSHDISTDYKLLSSSTVFTPRVENQSIKPETSNESLKKEKEKEKLPLDEKEKEVKKPVIKRQKLQINKVAPILRQKIIESFTKEYLRIYAHPANQFYSHPEALLKAAEDAKKQEDYIHDQSDKTNYQSLAANLLLQLKKRPLAISKDDFVLQHEYMEKEERKKSLIILSNRIEDCVQFTLTPQQLYENDFPQKHFILETDPSHDPVVKECDRCQKNFPLKPPNEMSKEDFLACQYHWGKVHQISPESGRILSCCQQNRNTDGCSFGPHVYCYKTTQQLQQRFRFSFTTKNDQSKHNLIALDAEMAYTSLGMEAIRLSVVDFYLNQILDTLLTTEGEIMDLNTRFSGITEEQYQNGTKMSLTEAKNILLKQISTETILVGHSLDSDLKALRWQHDQIIDTSLLFPHPKGLPYRYSLAYLSQKLLRKFIQVEKHDSIEDAKSKFHLMIESCNGAITLQTTK